MQSNDRALHYAILHKPYGVLSQFTPELPGQRTLAEFGLPKGLYASGRLDSDSEGLLLLTNDGPLIKRLLDPGKGHERTYLVQVDGIPTDESITRLENGVVIQKYHTLPARARLLEEKPSVPPRDPPIRVRKSIPTSWIEIKLTEGKNRQVRRMTAAIGYPTLRLIRTAIGNLLLDDLAPGQWRELTSSEISELKMPLVR
ncbi:MAG: pseudouridine synthase [Bacteroidota bacterium]|nr:pseudouridine synthase [Bacteroidota bacterium]MDP4232747.1 pseudouridine synthase [Bacteroidota bacterium]MDP4244063.1 pseudouridine synthase [Bacteroidota bacterium]MDP4287577.1 pseudouridine synthase [Bacteroidota bacterium]